MKITKTLTPWLSQCDCCQTRFLSNEGHKCSATTDKVSNDVPAVPNVVTIEIEGADRLVNVLTEILEKASALIDRGHPR